MSSATIRFPLSPLDHLPPPNYTCSTFYLPLKPGIRPVEAFEVLQEGLHKTFAQLPWLSGKVWPQSADAPGWRPGQLEIRHDPVDINGPRPYQLRFNQLPSSLRYEDLRESAFPPDTFEDNDLIWAPFMPDVSNGCEIFVAQANFLPGGCLVTGAFHHAAGDGNACFMTVNLWADHCKAVQSQSAAPMAPPPECSDRTLHERIWAKEETGKSSDKIDLDVWRLLGLDPFNLQLAESSNGREPLLSSLTAKANGQRMMKSGIFYMSPSNFTALQDDCIQELGAAAKVSGTHAICGLVWRCLLKARFVAAARKTIEPPAQNDDIARLDMILDERSGFSQSLPQTYLGNHTVTLQSSMPLSTLTSPDTSIASVAGVIRANASRINSIDLLDMYTLVRNLPSFDELRRRKRERQLSIAHSAMMITSMLMIPSGQVNFGDRVFGNGGKPDGARPLMGAFNRSGTRICFVLPRTTNGGVEFIVNLYEEEMDLLLDDEEFERYAMFLA
ncbi:MAG: hypothetical protein MMC33_006951 [Icmadophila ericetorum]|nr:hypothetical protein [Icmadophila ericetorum]